MNTDRVLTVVGWLGMVLVALVVGRFGALDPRWDAYLVWAAVGGVACVLISAIVGWRNLRQARAAEERAKLPMVTVASAVAIVVVLNILAGRYSARWDLTSERIYQLAPETRAALRALDAPVRILLAAQQADRPYRDRLKEYSKASGLVTIQYIDLDALPTVPVASELRVQRGSDLYARETTVIEYKGQRELIHPASEQDFTNALIRLREGRTRKAYFTTGHAERDTASTERPGYTSIAGRLRQENFRIEKINLARDGEVPADATLVIVAGPRVDFFRAEVESLGRYLGKGGAILFMVDPFEDLKRYITESGTALFMMDPSSAFKTGELRNLTSFVREQGAELASDVVVDASQRGQFLGTDASVPVATTYPPHPITERLTSLTAYPMARSVTPIPGDGRTVSSIIETSDHTWSETDVQQLAAGTPSMDTARGDRPGPVSLGVAVSARPASPPAGSGAAQPRETRLVVVGDSDFVANYSANVPGNADMFLSIVDWLAQEKVVTIPPRMPQQRLVTMTAAQHRNMFWFAVLLLPGAAAGAAVYLRRHASLHGPA